MTLLATALTVLSTGALLLALISLFGGTRNADNIGKAILPEALRGGSTGGLPTALEGVGGRWTRAGLLLLVALVCAGGGALALTAV